VVVIVDFPAEGGEEAVVHPSRLQHVSWSLHSLETILNLRGGGGGGGGGGIVLCLSGLQRGFDYNSQTIC